MTSTCISAANYLIEKTNEYNSGVDFIEQISMSCKRLQKLLYFSEVYYMHQHGGQAMLKDEFYAWPSGPTVPAVYDKFMRYEGGQMMFVETTDKSLNKDMRDALDAVFEKTVDIDTNTLVEMSQVFGGPWNQVYDPKDPGHFQIVTKESMYRFYRKYHRIVQTIK